MLHGRAFRGGVQGKRQFAAAQSLIRQQQEKKRSTPARQ